MTQTIPFRLPVGYAFEQHSETVSPETAEAVLRTRKKRCYTQAWRSDDTDAVRLIRHRWICPYCGGRTPAYPRQFGHLAKVSMPDAPTVHRWCDRQLSLFEDHGTPLSIQQPLKPGPAYTCPRCGFKSVLSQGQRDAVFTVTRHKIALAVEITDIARLLLSRRLPTETPSLSFPLTETVVFNLGKGTVSLKLTDRSGRVFSVRDITQSPHEWYGSPTHTALCRYVVLQRQLKRLFTAHFKQPLPFTGEELTPDNYVLMTRFVGFDRDFYDAIPFEGTSLRLDDSFGSIPAHLHTPGQAAALLKRSTLPQGKNVRKLLFCNPGTLFYLREYEILWDILQNYDLFYRLICRLLALDRIFDLLIPLHLYGGLAEGYRAFGEVRSKATLVYVLSDYTLSRLTQNALLYAAMTPRQQKAQRQNWKKWDPKSKEISTDILWFDEMCRTVPFSFPMLKTELDIPPCTINGFRFAPMSNRREYRIAGEALANCLRSRALYEAPVVLVSLKGRAVAALEVSGDTVGQAYQHHNTLILPNSDLGQAVSRWMAHFGLHREK